jgi:hypothetical protein
MLKADYLNIDRSNRRCHGLIFSGICCDSATTWARLIKGDIGSATIDLVTGPLLLPFVTYCNSLEQVGDARPVPGDSHLVPSQLLPTVMRRTSSDQGAICLREFITWR